ncbi:MAG: hypothetical protein DSM106950_10125 [Stigonema ocellatum SAG 48.90 = DSM 106950]|nr:hypothetical protein [Stigonema ocellatum SAG 48.90 = DSM 106950]
MTIQMKFSPTDAFAFSQLWVMGTLYWGIAYSQSPVPITQSPFTSPQSPVPNPLFNHQVQQSTYDTTPLARS